MNITCISDCTNINISPIEIEFLLEEKQYKYKISYDKSFIEVIEDFEEFK